MRPTEEEQAQEIWSKGRYEGVEELKLRWIFNEDFYQYGGGNSEMNDSWPLHGLWTALEPYDCDLDTRVRDIAFGHEVEIWTLLHQVESVVRQGDVYTVTVQPAEAGYQIVRFATGQPIPSGELEAPYPPVEYAVIHFVDAAGRLLDRLPQRSPWSESNADLIPLGLAGTVIASDVISRVTSVQVYGDEPWRLPWIEGTIVRREDGSRLRFEDLKPGDDILASGFMPQVPEPPNTLLAAFVRVLDPVDPTALPIPFRSEELGLELSYPRRWSVSRTEDGRQTWVLSGPLHGAGPEPLQAWLSITVRPAPADTSLDALAESELARYPDLVPQIRRSEITLGGEPAVVLDGVPGQLSTRQAFVLHEGKLYDIFVSPIDEPMLPDLQAEGEAIWQAVVESWQFLDKY